MRVTQAFVPAAGALGQPGDRQRLQRHGLAGGHDRPGRGWSPTIVGLAYPASKAAVNMLTTQYAKALPEMRVNAVDPGYTATDLNGRSGHQTVQEGTDAIVAMARLGPDGPSGTFVDRHGAVPW